MRSRILGRLLIALAVLIIITRSAHADMGPIVIVPVLAAPVWHLLIGAATLLPKFMAGRRMFALKIYGIAVVGAWMINLGLPVDGFSDFSVLFFLPLLASIGMVIWFRRLS